MRIFYEQRYIVIIEIVWTFNLKSVPAKFKKIFKTYFLSYYWDKFVKICRATLDILLEHQLQPSSPFVATIGTANIFYIE